MRISLVAIATLIAALPALSNATPVRIDFSVTSTALSDTYNYPIGTSGSGFFTFDDSLLPGAGSSWVETTTALTPIDASFSWFGSTFDESQIRIFQLVTDATGALTQWGIGTYGGCGTSQSSGGLACISSPNSYDDFYATGYLVPWYSNARALLGQAKRGGFADGSGPDSLTVLPVPEPATTALLTLGMLGIAVVRRRRKV
jgi:hypothetical protein